MDIRQRLYQMLAIENEAERETALEEIANEFTTYGNQVSELTSERDSLKETLTRAESDRDVYKSRLAKITQSTLIDDKKDDEIIEDYESKIFRKRDD